MPSVVHNGVALLVSDTVLKAHDLFDGQSVSQSKVMELIRDNAAEFPASMKVRKSQGLDAPESGEIDKILGRPSTLS